MVAEMHIEVRGLREAQTFNRKAVSEFSKSTGIREKMVRVGTVSAARFAMARTHRQTGTLSASHRSEINASVPEGVISISGSARNPLVGSLGTPPSEYGVYEHRRGGEHAFYKLVFDIDAPLVIRRVADVFGAELRRL